ncbi:RNA polymerase sigma factor [Aquimarina brevivitae]|uniref:RNA polymerase sigma-70 factor (ECF subfamily) n=1 Tax=Aquimarina brevivitae TaxID=323412 RepID=A0A4Q7NUW6_9FLAO|nr:RNA polymerase sigma factor [Aquimarina brevivitae]RZS90648.1 RNA polymerase sigma-70 factor (ECF subfamily) [Aquimarina brevivitae]
MALTHLNTEELIEKCRNKDEQAQMETYDRYYKAMYNTAFRILKDSAEAEDIMQESFLTAFLKLPSLEDNKMFGAWLKKIVINASLSALKKRANYYEVTLETVDYRLTEEEPENQELVIDKVSTVLETLKELKDSYSTALSLHYIEGFDYEEIGQIMGISYANCRTLLSRAKQSLRKKLEVA